MTQTAVWLYWLGSYLLGGVPFGLLVSRAFGHDPRRHGSGNIGATNVNRVAGRLAGVLTLALDVGKGALPVWLASRVLDEPLGPAGAALAAVAGHVFTPYLRFRGGKGVATAAGAFAVLTPLPALIALGVFLLLTAGTRYVSLGSVGASVALPALCLWLAPGSGQVAAAAGCGLLVIVRHLDNLKRLLSGEEDQIGDSRH
ncbi:MAG: glycerol-3-phosphate 1-O-acyltransferase PlsY [Acidobacteriota bacterium]